MTYGFMDWGDDPDGEIPTIIPDQVRAIPIAGLPDDQVTPVPLVRIIVHGHLHGTGEAASFSFVLPIGAVGEFTTEIVRQGLVSRSRISGSQN